MSAKFIDFAKQCKFRVHHDEKCINPDITKKLYRLVGSCQYNFCPLKDEFMRLSGSAGSNNKGKVEGLSNQKLTATKPVE